MEPTHIFILRIWREPREIAAAPAVWRGVIQYAPTGERRAIQELADIILFITSYTEWNERPEDDSG
jgi:hypothetical protein